MENFEDKLNAMLSSPEAMDKVMNLARSLGGNTTEKKEAESSKQEPDLSGLLGGLLGGDSAIDPEMLGKLMQLWGAYNQGDPKKVTLMQAVKPYLHPERQARVDRALQTMKLANVAKHALDSDMLGDLFGQKKSKRKGKRN